MHTHPDVHVVAQGGLDQLKQFQRVLRAAGVSSEITAPPGAGCGS